jgi:glycosyltransferase involved in cell wall biosynthesis
VSPRKTSTPRVAIISDTVDDTNGIAIGLRRLVAAARREGHVAHLVGAASPGVVDDVVRFPAAMSASLPIYPDMTWSVPELPPLVSWLAESADIVQVATPGPFGIAGMIAARMLGLPVIAQYHTEVAEYAARMSGLPFVRGLVEPIVGWFYKQADICLAPSQVVGRRLVSFGIAEERIWQVRRGVDRELFSPARRDRAFFQRFGIDDGPVALYVGRLSREKNLDALTSAWRLVHARCPGAHLLVVGSEGPLKGTFKAPGMVEIGGLYGPQLATVFASSDVFVFPSETETFGNVVVEAAASGLPAIVASAGASSEHVKDGVTGFVVDGGNPDAIAAATLSVLADAPRSAFMGQAAREHSARYELSAAVQATWQIYERVARARSRDAAKHVEIVALGAAS